jgi:hypothetical protein
MQLLQTGLPQTQHGVTVSTFQQIEHMPRSTIIEYAGIYYL